MPRRWRACAPTSGAAALHSASPSRTSASPVLLSRATFLTPGRPRSAAVRDGLASRGIELAAVAGTFFNIIHADPAERARGFARLRALARTAKSLGAPCLTFATGTCHSGSMWAAHPDNDTPAAFEDMLGAMAAAVQIATEHEIVLAFEPEVSNVVDTAAKARRLLDHFDSPFLKVVIDGANLFHIGELPRMREVSPAGRHWHSTLSLTAIP